VLASRANKVTSKGKEQGENKEANPAMIASNSKPPPAEVGKAKRGY
jgi:hypothetical protein